MFIVKVGDILGLIFVDGPKGLLYRIPSLVPISQELGCLNYG